MKRLLFVFVFLLIGVQIAEPVLAARRVEVRKGARGRTTVVVHRGWPLRRPARAVYVRPVRRPFLVHPGAFLPVVVFPATVVAVSSAPHGDRIVWEDSETLSKNEDWTEFTLNADSRGTRLWLEVASGKAQFDWAEVVFENGTRA